jgi:heat-inducible transcriptional repressor
MVRPTDSKAMTDRSQALLKALVERYIRDGQPVGSRTLSRDSGMDISPATIRNVMADLEELGLVRSPHTSAGRVPTAQGYRVFVDTLLTVQPPDSEAISRLAHRLDPDERPFVLVEAASSLISDLTRFAGIVTLPRPDTLRLRQVEFLPLSDNQVLVIVVVNEREVQNRIIRTARRYSPAELEQAANYVNIKCAGKDLAEIRSGVIREMHEAREHMNRMMQATLEMAEKALVTDRKREDFVVVGQMNLMESVGLGDTEKLRHLFDAFNQKRDILHLLDQSLQAKGVQIFIGEESGFDVLEECSIVTAPYEMEGQTVGVLGVVGPTRMAYDRVIPLVDLTAKLLGAALNQQH